MKRLFILILPVMVCISVFFYFKGDSFNFRIFLDVLSGWEFDNGYTVLVDLKELFEEGITYIRVGDNSGDITLLLKGIFEILKSSIVAPVYLFRALVLYLGDLVHNMGIILDFLIFN